jgi:hypothetical protein
MAHPQK